MLGGGSPASIIFVNFARVELAFIINQFFIRGPILYLLYLPPRDMTNASGIGIVRHSNTNGFSKKMVPSNFVGCRILGDESIIRFTLVNENIGLTPPVFNNTTGNRITVCFTEAGETELPLVRIFHFLKCGGW